MHSFLYSQDTSSFATRTTMTNPHNESSNPAIEHQLTGPEEGIRSSTPVDGFYSAATFVDSSDIHRNAEEPAAKASTAILHAESNIENTTSQPLVTTGDDPYYTEGWRNPGWLAGGSLFLVTTGTFGMMMSWGTFQPVYLEKVYPGQTDAFHIAFVGTIGHALSSSLGIPLSLVINRIGHRNTLAIGAVLCPLGLFLASIATQLWQTFIFHGFLFGLGASFCFSASFMLPSQWFVRQRALVNGLANTGAAVGGLCFSPLSEYLMQTLGYRNALRVLGAILFGLFALATVLVRVRYPPSSSSSSNKQQRDNNYGSISARASSPLLSIPFALAMVFSLLAPFGYIIPFHFMPTYAMVELGCSSSVASTMVSVGMATNILSRISLGWIGDRLGQINTLFIATFVSGE